MRPSVAVPTSGTSTCAFATWNATRFYRDVLGFRVTQRDAESVFLAAGDYHHHVALNTWDAPAAAPGPNAAGLHHFAIRLPDVGALAGVVVRILRAGHELLG